MALKKGILDNYIKEREVSNKKMKITDSKYSYNRVFDEPESLKKQKTNLSIQTTIPNPVDEEIIPSVIDNDISIGFKRFQTVSTTDKDKAELTSGVEQRSNPSADTEISLNGFNRLQTVSNETVSIGFNRLQTDASQKDAIGFKRFQTVSETVSKMPSLSELKILFYLQELLSTKGSGIMQRAQIAEALSLTLAGIKTGLVRLKKKGFIDLVASAKGRYTGYTSYSLTSKAYLVLSSPEAISLLGFKRFQTVSQTASSPTISSSYINKTTTTLPEEWRKINTMPLADIGFTEKQLDDIYQTKLATPEIVQESINHFAYGLEHNHAKYKNYADPLNVLIGCLRKGKIWYESNYISPQERAIRELAEQKRAERERIDAFENEIMLSEFEAWKLKLTPLEKQAYLPGKIIGPENAHLKDYFIKNLWLDLKSRLLSSL